MKVNRFARFMVVLLIALGGLIMQTGSASATNFGTQTYGYCYLNECYRATIFVEGDANNLHLRGNSKVECYYWYNQQANWYPCVRITDDRVWLYRNGVAWLGSVRRDCDGNCTQPYYNSSPWGVNAAGAQVYRARLGSDMSVCTRNKCYAISVYSLDVSL